MCGIVGFAGEVPAREKIFAGLEEVENRGYDSAGVALVDPAVDLFHYKVKREGEDKIVESLAPGVPLNLPHRTHAVGHLRGTHPRERSSAF